MRFIAIIVALIFALGLGAYQAGAQDPLPAPVDLGIVDPLESACAAVIEIGQGEGLTVYNCRRNAPDDMRGLNRATVHLRLATDRDVYLLDVSMQKSLWSLSSITQR